MKLLPGPLRRKNGKDEAKKNGAKIGNGNGT